MMHLTNALLDRVVALVEQKLSAQDVHQVRCCFADYLGVTLAGSAMLHDKLLRYQTLIGSKGDFHAIGGFSNISAETAAFLNGLSSHAAELDDGDRFGMFHPGAPLFSALLVLTQLKPVSEIQFCKAVVAGYEASMLIARTLQPHIKEKGYHGTGIAGTIGAAMACSVALESSREEMKAALSAACTSAAGLLKVIKGKSQMKPLNVAYAAQNGLQSALMAKVGFAGSDDVLDGDLGFLNALTEKHNPTVILEAATAAQPLIYSIYVKPYAACRHCHAPIEAALNIAEQDGFSVNLVESVEVATYSWAIRGHEHTAITGMSSAKMSIPYSVAAALQFRSGDVDVFDGDYLANEAVHQLTQKVTVTEDPEMTRRAPEERGAEVKVKIEDKIYRYFVALPKGEPENPVSDEELLQKMKSLCRFAGTQETLIQNLSMFVFKGQLSSKLINTQLYPSHS
jgi:2-methylcitrate dehydratase PrpD